MQKSAWMIVVVKGTDVQFCLVYADALHAVTNRVCEMKNKTKKMKVCEKSQDSYQECNNIVPKIKQTG